MDGSADAVVKISRNSAQASTKLLQSHSGCLNLAPQQLGELNRTAMLANALRWLVGDLGSIIPRNSMPMSLCLASFICPIKLGLTPNLHPKPCLLCHVQFTDFSNNGRLPLTSHMNLSSISFGLIRIGGNNARR
jgi:hypothetical protein